MDPDRPLRWLFLDMNSFFASAEQHDRPELRGKPLGVTPTPGDHSICIAVSVEAKAAGVRMGMRPPEARRLCPGFVAVKARPDRYVELFKSLKASTEKHAPIFKSYSVDEWCVKLLGEERIPVGALELARRIKRQMIDDHSPALRCSIGLAPTRLLAKIATELRKPDGLETLTPDDLPGKLAHFDLTDLTGIAEGTAARLRRHGVHTVEQLWHTSRSSARDIWGSVQGEHWWYGFHGVDVPEVKTKRSTMGHAHVLPPKFRNDDDAFAVAVRLLCKAAARLRFDDEDDQPYWAHGLALSVKYTNHERFVDHRTFPATQDTPTLLARLRDLWQQRPYVVPKPTDPVRRLPGSQPDTSVAPQPKHVAVTLFDLLPRGSATLPLFPEQLPEAGRAQRVSHALDTINRQLQRDRHLRAGRPDAYHLLHLGTAHDLITNYAMDDKIAFGRIPETKVKM
ncbi:MAG: type VI secretion protein ImpB [Planctomycetota bacterium]